MTVHDANQYGIFVDSQLGSITVSITGATVSNIGHHTGTAFTPDGVQTGIGIIYDSGPGGPTAHGSITSSSVTAYQKGGIEVNRNSNVTTTENTVTGLGPVLFIAQNGIEYARDAAGVIRGNTVSDNFYTGKTGVLADLSPCDGINPPCPPGRQYVSTGILLVLIDPNNIQRGQNDVSNGNQRNYRSNHRQPDRLDCSAIEKDCKQTFFQNSFFFRQAQSPTVDQCVQFLLMQN